MRAHARHADLMAVSSSPHLDPSLYTLLTPSIKFRHWALLPRKTISEYSRPTGGTDLNSTSRNVNIPGFLAKLASQMRSRLRISRQWTSRNSSLWTFPNSRLAYFSYGGAGRQVRENGLLLVLCTRRL